MYEFSGISGRCRPFHELGWPTQDQLSIPVLLSHVCPSPRPDDGRLKPHKDEQPPVEARPTVGHPTATSVLAGHQRRRHEPLPRTCPCLEH